MCRLQRLRTLDRERNEWRYPHLTYPDLYLLRGGYSAFVTQHGVRARSPQASVLLVSPPFSPKHVCVEFLGRGAVGSWNRACQYTRYTDEMTLPECKKTRSIK